MFSNAYGGRKRTPVFMCVCLLALVYFGYHGMHGANGLNARDALEKRIVTLNLDLSHLQQRKRTLDRNVSLMRPEQIDPDMLDEEVRRLLNFARPDEIIIMEASHR